LPAAALRPARVGLRLVELDGAAAATHEVGGALGAPLGPRGGHLQLVGLPGAGSLPAPDPPRADEGGREASPRAVPGGERGIETCLLVGTGLRARSAATGRSERPSG